MEMMHSAVAQTVAKKIENIIQMNIDHHVGQNLLCVCAFPKAGPPVVHVDVYWITQRGGDGRVAFELDINKFIDDALSQKFEYIKGAVEAIITEVSETLSDMKPVIFGNGIVDGPETLQ